MDGEFDDYEYEHPTLTERRLKTIWDEAVSHKRKVRDVVSTEAVDISKERTAYFEKVALGCGATIAATVSFIGAHSSQKVHPTWLLRSVLVSFAAGLVTAQARNFIHPYYAAKFRWVEFLRATQKSDRAKYHYVMKVPTFNLETGLESDREQYQKSYLAGVQKVANRVKIESLKSDRYFTAVFALERASVGVVILGFILLIALAWINF